MTRILVVRLGAMGDIIHAMPAAASLERSGASVVWAVEARWAALLTRWTTFVVERTNLERITRSMKELRKLEFDIAVDLQGLLKSAVVAKGCGARRRFGFDRRHARESLATLLYTNRVAVRSRHIVDQMLDIAAAAGGEGRDHCFRLPDGSAEGKLPDGPFVLASPLAGWTSKQWPFERYSEIAERLPIPLVINAPPDVKPHIHSVHIHHSGLDGLIDATRRATAVLGLDSGPMHLAAAFGRPGVALFGPTDPARNGPVGDSFTVIRSPSAVTSYRRGDTIDESMRRIGVDEVYDALTARLEVGR